MPHSGNILYDNDLEALAEGWWAVDSPPGPRMVILDIHAMGDKKRVLLGAGRPVYETGRGRLCPDCGQPVDGCRCRQGADGPVPASLTCVLRLEKKGRSGKTVTVVAGLPQNTAFVTALAADLKRACGTGGTAAPGAVEIQGDQRDRLRPLLVARGFRVKG